MQDVASRKVLAHKVATTLKAFPARKVIEQAFARHGIPQIVNTDQGSQFTAKEFADAVLARGCQLSMDGRGAWRDNVFMERVWRTLKYEHVCASVAVFRAVEPSLSMMAVVVMMCCLPCSISELLIQPPRACLGVKSRLFIDSFDEQIRFLLPPGLERLNWSLMMQGALRDAVVVG